MLTAADGSTHGYDVTDPTTVSAELGGADGLAALSAAARAARDGADRRHRAQPRRRRRPARRTRGGGTCSGTAGDRAYASYFDIDWADNGADGKLALPVLGVRRRRRPTSTARRRPAAPRRPRASRSRRAPATATRRAGARPPALPAGRTGAADCAATDGSSPITSLAALRQEDPRVFEASHGEVRRWCRDGPGRRHPGRPPRRPLRSRPATCAGCAS